MLTIGLGLLSFILAFVTFCVDLSVIIPARNRFNEIPGIHAKLVSPQRSTCASTGSQGQRMTDVGPQG